ncbi:MAG: chorismate-binding protein [Acidimicrobiales bacterium]
MAESRAELESCDFAVVGDRLFTDLTDLSSDPAVLDVPAAGTWVVVLAFDGPPLFARFTEARPAPPDFARAPRRRPWRGLPPRSEGRSGPAPASWTSSLGRRDYTKRVGVIREAIAAGDVYQVNLCRRLSATVPADADLVGLGRALAARHASPFGALVCLRSAGVSVASASPECFLRRRGRGVESRPIKGTAAPGHGFEAKDRAENVMIVDLVRNDLGRVCEPGSVRVPALCHPERHPGLVHLVSTVTGRLRADVGWRGLLAATFPPGSVTGAPKAAALGVIAGLEPVPRSVYCGAVGWVDAASGDGDLNVAIRTFWLDDGALHFGTGAAVTWDSTPEGEWEETELKARRLLAIAAG